MLPPLAVRRGRAAPGGAERRRSLIRLGAAYGIHCAGVWGPLQHGTLRENTVDALPVLMYGITRWKLHLEVQRRSPICPQMVRSIRCEMRLQRGASQKPSAAPPAAFFFMKPCDVPKRDERRVLQGYLLSWSRSCCSSISAGVQYFFVALHAAQHGTTLPFVLRPPRESGTM
jgi:hypothetical protein